MPPNTTGPMTAVIVAPGGSYRALASNLEGRAPANYFNTLGVAAFVLRYRLGPQYHHPIELGDAQRAIRTVRARAAEWHIAADRIGFMGFSAGGHLASSASTHFDNGNASAADPIDRVSSRPDFADPRLSGHLAHRTVDAPGLEDETCWATRPIPRWRAASRARRRSRPSTPPTFIYQTNADTTMPAENAVSYYLALRKAGVPAELHIFKDGRHGSGLGMTDPALVGMAEAARELAARQRVLEVAMIASMSCARHMSVR